MSAKPALGKRILLISFGLLLSLIILESGLRLAGFALTALQERRNLRSLQTAGSYRILCLGESTTQGQYPPFLAASLNQNSRQVKFTVIDEGKGGTMTPAILSHVEGYLDKYHPDMVVAMMGINDGLAPHLPPEFRTDSHSLFESLRIYELARLIRLHFAVRRDAAAGRPVPRNSGPASEDEYVELGADFLARGQFDQSEASLKKALALNPRNLQAYLHLGDGYKLQGRFAEAEASYEKAVEIDSSFVSAYLQLGYVDRSQNKFKQAEAGEEAALKLDPKNGWAYCELGDIYKQEGRLKLAERWYRKGLEVSDSLASARLYGELATISANDGRTAQANEYYEKARRAVEAGPMSSGPSTARNYQALKAILDRRKIKLVCVQYPMRSVASLKEIFAGQADGVIFVDNEGPFRAAVGRDGVAAYFRDMFGGDFGHCTDKGNQLLGENIAKAILRELFGA
jgi:tetratricopeptide (TPR) repeat protein